MIHWTHELEAKLKNLFENTNTTIKALCIEFDVSKSHIVEKIYKMGLVRFDPLEAKKNDIIHRWVNTLQSMQSIAGVYNTSYYHIRRIIGTRRKLVHRNRMKKRDVSKFIDIFEKGQTSLFLVKNNECPFLTGGKHTDGFHKCCGLPVFKNGLCKKHFNRSYKKDNVS